MTKDDYLYQRNLTHIQIYCGIGYTIAGFLLALGTALMITGLTYIDTTVAAEQMGSPLLGKGFNLLSNGMSDIIAGAGLALATMILGGFLVNREYKKRVKD